MIPTPENLLLYKKNREEHTVSPKSRDGLIQAIASCGLGEFLGCCGKSFLFSVDTEDRHSLTITEKTEREDGREETFDSVSEAVDKFMVDGRSLADRIGCFSVSPILVV